jgi:diguanylate cyclase (GGDEF)-like protein
LDSAALLKELVAIGIAIAGEPHLRRLLDVTLTGALKLTHAEAGAIYLLKPEGLEFAMVKNPVLTRRYGEAEVNGRFEGQRLPVDGSSLAGYATATGRALNVADAYRIPATAPYHLQTRFDRENQYQTRSVLSVPLRAPASSTALGVVQVINARDDHDEVIPFTSDSEEIISLLAAYAAVAIHNVQLAEQSLNDHLTGAFNRRYLAMRLDEEISRTQRTGEPLSLAIVDVDRFKQVNDTHGHPAGDTVIRGVAQLLINQSRAYTVVTRYGGDEFAIVLPSTPKAGAMGYGERIKRIVASYPFPTGPVTVSIGTATLPGDAETRDDLVGAADRALYRAKQGGRNRVGG